MTSREVRVRNDLGLHARAAARFVQMASRYRSRVQVERAGRVMDGKSILGILLLAAAKGSKLIVTAEGEDELQAVEALKALVESGFGEETA
ncbi:MAG: HPr family phosphocarrier protein [Vicinamibacteria bacterium]|nr:HPr family phosphocarrier protein [Vicinamibacteria bacterium]